MNKRPNILFITTDQQRADCMGYENPQLRTPHLDALAKSGTRFSNCISPSIVCQPARASILTGSLPLTNGVWDNGVDLDPKIGEAKRIFLLRLLSPPPARLKTGKVLLIFQMTGWVLTWGLIMSNSQH
jgi:arylsulfatase A-like enzyme